MARVDVVGDDAMLKVYPYQFPSRLEVTTRAGDLLTCERLVNRGGTELPLSPAELATKFADNVGGRLDPSTADRVVREVGALATGGDVSPIKKALR